MTCHLTSSFLRLNIDSTSCKLNSLNPYRLWCFSEQVLVLEILVAQDRDCKWLVGSKTMGIIQNKCFLSEIYCSFFEGDAFKSTSSSTYCFISLIYLIYTHLYLKGDLKQFTSFSSPYFYHHKNHVKKSVWMAQSHPSSRVKIQNFPDPSLIL